MLSSAGLLLAIPLILVLLITGLVLARRSLPCPAWLAWIVERDNPLFRENSASRILGHLAARTGMHVLDYGCGPGRLSLALAKAVGPRGRVTAFDIQAEMLEKVRAKAQAAGLANIDYVRAESGQGALSRAEYDRAVLVTVLGEIPDKAKAFEELHSCLKTGGILSVTEVIADPHFQRRETVIALATQAGFVMRAFYGRPWAYTIHFGKGGPIERSAGTTPGVDLAGRSAAPAGDGDWRDHGGANVRVRIWPLPILPQGVVTSGRPASPPARASRSQNRFGDFLDVWKSWTVSVMPRPWQRVGARFSRA